MRLFLVSLMLLACHCASTKAVLNGAVASNSEPHKVSLILFRGPVEEVSADGIVNTINQAQTDGTEVVVLEINSPGGEVDAAWRIMKAIEDSRVPVVCVADLQAASAGFYILETCHVRLMTPHTALMLHQPAMRGMVPGGGRAEDWQNVANHLRVMHETMVDHIAKRLKVPKPYIKEKTEGSLEWWLDQQEALKVGAVDGVVDSTRSVVGACQKSLTCRP